MKNLKRVIAGAMALLSAVSVASCGESIRQRFKQLLCLIKVKVASTDDIATLSLMVRKGVGVAFLFDINPTKKEPEKRTDLTLFEEKGESKIKYSQTSSNNV